MTKDIAKRRIPRTRMAAVMAAAALIGGCDGSSGGSATAQTPAPAPAPTEAASQSEAVQIPEYMDVGLRARVQQLKQDLADAPTTVETAAQRALALFDWANAYAMTGRPLPVNLTLMISRTTRPGTPSRAVLASIDDYIREMTLYEEQPDALGPLTADSTGPFQADSMQTFTQTYTVGTKPIEAGGGLILGRHFMANTGPFQTTDPQGANFVSAETSNPNVTLTATTHPLSGMFGGFRGAAAAVYFEVAEGQLVEGDTVTLTIGDTAQGGPGYKMQSFSNDGLRFPVFVVFGEGEQMFSLPKNLYSVEGGPVVRVQGFAPSTATPGEEIEISVRSEDPYRNRATGPKPAYRVSVNGEPHGTIPASDDAISLYTLSFADEGVYRVTFESEDGSVIGDTNPVRVQSEGENGIFWGETHGHSAYAEGQGTVDAYYTFGRDDARLDFLGMSEHDIWLDDYEWQTLIDATQRYYAPGDFITYLSYEWTAPTDLGGHHNVFYRTPEGRERTGLQRHPSLAALYQGLRAANDPDDVLIIPHAHNTGEYRLNDAKMETLVEIMSLHGTFEWFGQRYLDQGHEVGFIAASDDHLSHPGYAAPLGRNLGSRSGLAAVVAPEKSRDAIFDAMKDRFTYATTGERIILDFDLSGGRMGERIAMTDQRDLRLTVHGTAPLDSMTVVKNGIEVHREDYRIDTTGQSDRIALSFQSETDPKIRDVALGWRDWVGVLTVTGADIEDFSAPGFKSVLTSSLERGDEPGTLKFSTATRGNMRTIVLDLANRQPDAAISLSIEPAREYGTPKQVRTNHRYPAVDLTLPLSAMEDGIYVERLPGAIEDDRVTLRSVRTDPPMDATLTWSDPGPVQVDDHYFVRVVQTDGAMAWTSPVWVGGFSRQDQWYTVDE